MFWLWACNRSARRPGFHPVPAAGHMTINKRPLDASAVSPQALRKSAFVSYSVTLLHCARLHTLPAATAPRSDRADIHPEVRTVAADHCSGNPGGNNGDNQQWASPDAR